MRWMHWGVAAVGLAFATSRDATAQIPSTLYPPASVPTDCPPVPTIRPPVMIPQTVPTPMVLPPTTITPPMTVTPPTQPTPVPQPTPPVTQPPLNVSPLTSPVIEATTPQPLLSAESGLALGGDDIAIGDGATGYIDPAIPRTRLRTRGDAAYGNNRPDRAEFFYPKCGCFKVAGIDPHAPGPPLAETNVDYQEVSQYFEFAPTNRFSVFIDVPYRLINPTLNDNANGFSDLIAGFKYAFVAEKDQFLTFQFRAIMPTGDGFQGLGTEHLSLEPGLLYWRPLSERLLSESEFRVWVPIDGTDFAGTVVRYGTGLSYKVIDGCKFRASPVAEFVGWTVLDGMESAPDLPLPLNLKDAVGDTIINAKVGVRFGFGELIQPGFSRYDLYLGYGRALTGEVWYKDLFRIEARMNF